MEYFELEPFLKIDDYLIPKGINEATDYLEQYGNKLKILCGGTIIYEMTSKRLIPHLEKLMDIGHVGLEYIKQNGEMIYIGAATRLVDILNFNLFNQNGPYDALRESVGGISVQILNVGSVGGEICSGISYCDLPIAALTLDAKVKVVKSTFERIIPIEEFYLSPFVTELRDDEIMTELQINKLPPHSGAAFEKLTFMHEDYSIVNAAARIILDDKGKCKDARVIVSSNLNMHLISKKAEQELIGKMINDEIIAISAKIAQKDFQPLSDARASADYRKKVAKNVCEKAIKKAFERAKNSGG